MVISRSITKLSADGLLLFYQIALKPCSRKGFQPFAGLLLERRDLLADGGLGDAQGIGSSRERPAVDHPDERLKLTQIHSALPRSAFATDAKA